MDWGLINRVLSMHSSGTCIDLHSSGGLGLNSLRLVHAQQWDAKLKQWTDWIVNCQVDYPGPPHSYTNFYRCADVS